MKNKRHLTAYESAILEVENAKENLKIAQNHFDYVEPKYFGIANEELTFAQMRLRMALVKAKLLAPKRVSK